MLVSAEELAWALDTHVDYAAAVLDRIRAKQRREPYIPPIPVQELTDKINRLKESAQPIPMFLQRKQG